jgi:hypothetical protein
MTFLKKTLPLALGALFLATSVQATTIDFSSASVGDSNPIIGVVHFTGGDAGTFSDAYVDNALLPTGNNYLVNGYADGNNGTPASGYGSYIGVTRTNSTNFGWIQLDIASISHLPGGTTLTIEAFDGANDLGGVSVTLDTLIDGFTPDDLYHSLTLDLSASAAGADSLRIYDNLDGNGFGDPFRIDNFQYTDYQPQGCTGPNCGGNPVPEPSALLLLGAGLIGLTFSRRKNAA